MPGDHFMILGHHRTHTILVQYVRLKELHLFSGKDQIISQCTCTLTISASIPASTSNMDKLGLGSNPIAREIIKLQTRSKEHFSKSVCLRLFFFLVCCYCRYKYPYISGLCICKILLPVNP